MVANQRKMCLGTTHQKVVLGVTKDHEDGFFLEDDLAQGDNVDVVKFSVDLEVSDELVSRLSSSFPILPACPTRTAISRIALWLMPVYVTTSPSLSGLNFLIAYSSPSLPRRSPGRVGSVESNPPGVEGLRRAL